MGLKDIELIDKIGTTQYFYRLKGRLIFKTVYLYLFKLKSNEKLKILHKEIQDGGWFTPEEALKMIEYKGARDILHKGIKIFSVGYTQDIAMQVKTDAVGLMEDKHPACGFTPQQKRFIYSLEQESYD